MFDVNIEEIEVERSKLKDQDANGRFILKKLAAPLGFDSNGGFLLWPPAQPNSVFALLESKLRFGLNIFANDRVLIRGMQEFI